MVCAPFEIDGAIRFMLTSKPVGTLRYLLVRPVGRVRLVAEKYGAVMTLLALAVLWIMAVAFSANGKILVSGCMDRTVKLWDVDSGKERATFEGPAGAQAAAIT